MTLLLTDFNVLSSLLSKHLMHVEILASLCPETDTHLFR